MPQFIPIEYHGNKYPPHIRCDIVEFSGNFDKAELITQRDYTLHTEHSFASRKWTSKHVADLPAIREAHRKNVPQLWKDKTWAKEFAQFIFNLVGENRPPRLIEVHPPFNDYCPTLDEFLERYAVFEEEILRLWPDTAMLLENRCGTYYTGGRFLVCKAKDVIEACSKMHQVRSLGMVLDYPQLFSQEYHDMNHFNIDHLEDLNLQFASYRAEIRGIHLWGKSKSSSRGHWVAHNGNFNTMFNYDHDVKNRFLESLHRLLDDDVPRYFVPEVDSGADDLRSILNDLIKNDFRFV